MKASLGSALLALLTLCCGGRPAPTPTPAPEADAGQSAAVDAGPTEAPDAGTTPPDSGTTTEAPDAGMPLPPGVIHLPAEPQRAGDATRGYDALVNDGYISLGIPWSGFEYAMSPLQSRDSLPGRRGKNARVGYVVNVSTNGRGVEIASPNCLSCHAWHLNGQLVIGLGRPLIMPVIPSGTASVPGLISLGLRTAAERAEYLAYTQRWVNAQEAGLNMVFGALASHRDPATLRWSSTRSFDASAGLQGLLDVPPWWRLRKKNALYANGMGRGDQVRHLMNMTVFSVEDVAEATALDARFVDIAAYLRSLTPPKFPSEIDAALAAAGQGVFEAACSRCHGTYGPAGEYPNLLIPVEQVGTDPELANRSWSNPAATAWFNRSFFATDHGARLEPSRGYMAPPLDGVWATAPFLHNGAIPTLEALLDSSKRPAQWPLVFNDYDLATLGWKTGPAATAYDTTQPGQSNRGHTFADALSADDRRALLEYLKTL